MSCQAFAFSICFHRKNEAAHTLPYRFVTHMEKIFLKKKYFAQVKNRVSQNFKHEKFIWDQTDSYSLRKRNAEKCKNYQNLTTFRGFYRLSKFHFITHPCDMGENSKIDFFEVIHFRLYFNFHNHKSSKKMWSFEVHYVGVAQKMGPFSNDLIWQKSPCKPPSHFHIF